MKHLNGVVLLLLSLSVFANEQTDGIPNIIVSATRSEQTDVTIPASITIIDEATIKNSGATHIVDVLRNQGMLQIRDIFGDGSRASVDMRGFGETASANTLILMDGRRLNNADGAAPDLNSIALKDVERIEITQGSSGVLFGDQAVGGVINIITRKPQAFGFDLDIATGSYGRRKVQGRVANHLDNGFACSLSMMSSETDNYREHNQQAYLNLLARLDYDYQEGNVFFEMQTIDEDLQTPGALLEAEIDVNRRQSLIDFNHDFSNTNTDVLRAGLSQRVSSNWSLLMEGMRREGDGDFLLNFRGCSQSVFFPCNTTADSNRREHTGWTPRLVGEYAIADGYIVITLGLDEDHYTYEINSLYVNTQNERNASSLYTQVIVPVSETLTLTLGMRKAEMEDRLTDATAYPMGIKLKDDINVQDIGLLYKPSTQWRLFVRLNDNYRFATVEEQAFTEMDVIGLKTQEGESVEWGAVWQSERAQLKFSATQLDLNNEIAFDPTANGPFGPFGGANVNFDATRRNTWMLQGLYRYNEVLSLNGSYSRNDAEFRSGVFESNTVSGVADAVARLAANYRLNIAWNGFVELQHLGEQFRLGDNDNTQEKREAYTLINASFAYQRNEWQISARINNLSDRDYIESANAYGALQPSPGRNFWLSLRYHIK